MKAPEAAILQVFRPSRSTWVTVGKAMTLPDVGKIVAVPYRYRRRLEGRVSLPLAVVEWAERWGAQKLIVRFDEEGACFALRLAEARRLGTVEAVDGQPELWLGLDSFEEIGWVSWPFITGPSVRLGLRPEHFPRQLALPLAG